MERNNTQADESATTFFPPIENTKRRSPNGHGHPDPERGENSHGLVTVWSGAQPFHTPEEWRSLYIQQGNAKLRRGR